MDVIKTDVSQTLPKRPSKDNCPPCQWGDEEASAEHGAAAVRPLAPASTRRGCSLSMGRSALPARVPWAASPDGTPRSGRVTRWTALWACATPWFR